MNDSDFYYGMWDAERVEEAEWWKTAEENTEDAYRPVNKQN